MNRKIFLQEHLSREIFGMRKFPELQYVCTCMYVCMHAYIDSCIFKKC